MSRPGISDSASTEQLRSVAPAVATSSSPLSAWSLNATTGSRGTSLPIRPSSAALRGGRRPLWALPFCLTPPFDDVFRCSSIDVGRWLLRATFRRVIVNMAATMTTTIIIVTTIDSVTSRTTWFWPEDTDCCTSGSALSCCLVVVDDAVLAVVFASVNRWWTTGNSRSARLVGINVE